MKLNINNHEFSIIWDGVYYKALSNYPNLSDWELKSIMDFIAYEKEHDRTVEIESENQTLVDLIKEEINKGGVINVQRPKKITECTACRQGGCLTDYLCHIAPLENAIKILESGCLLSAVEVRASSIEDLMAEDRNAANDPADFFEYIMFSWGNCQAGDRLVMERKFNRPPNEQDLSVDFTPGIRFYFEYDQLKNHPAAKSDGYHALKIEKSLKIGDYLKAIVIPEAHRKDINRSFLEEYGNKVYYIENDQEDIWHWSEKVYEFVCSL